MCPRTRRDVRRRRNSGVVVDAVDTRDFEDLHIAVIDGRLEAWIDVEFWDVVTFHQHDIKLTVSVPNLETLGASMGARIEATGMTGDVTLGVSSGAGLKVSDIVADTATINASTGGIMSLNGSCETAGIQTSTGALIVGGKFECTDLNIEASSGSTTLIYATGQVNANASSGAKVNLAGHPDHVDDETDSGGNVDVLI